MDLEDINIQIVESAKWLLKYYLKLKYEFKNVEFWGEKSFHAYDEKLSELRKIINSYR